MLPATATANATSISASAAIANKKSEDEEAAAAAAAAKPKAIALFDGKRTQNVSIFLGQVRKAPNKIAAMIYEVCVHC